jgi:hypothetical protein
MEREDNTVMISGNSYVKRGGQYQKMPFRVPPKVACDTYKEDVFGFFEQIAESSNLTLPVDCPVEPVRKLSEASSFMHLIHHSQASYEFFGFYPNLDKIPHTIIPSGDYFMEIIISKDGQTVSTSRAYATVHNI